MEYYGIKEERTLIQLRRSSERKLSIKELREVSRVDKLGW